VTLLTGRNDWDAGLDVVVEGDAVQVTDAAALNRLARAWATKWTGQWQYEVGDGCFHQPGSTEPVLVFAVPPTKVLAFRKGKFSHTTHKF
jgi:hypothetical protein